MSRRDALLEAIRSADLAHGLFENGQTLVIGVSGGPDSVALLDLLRSYAPSRGLKLHLAHLDHMLRDEGVEDAAWVTQLAADWALPSTIGARDVRRLAARQGRSLEDAARAARYAFLASVAAAQGAAAVVVAHHADDQAETVLMHFLRGAGLDGLKGMLPVSDYPFGAPDIQAIENLRPPLSSDTPWPPRLLRPLLAVQHREMVAYLREQGIAARDDASNSDPAFLRNRLRHELIPRLESINPRLRETLARNAEAIAGDLDFIEAALDRVWEAGVDASGRRVRVPSAVWQGLHPALQRRLLRRAAAHLGSGGREIGLEQVESARTLIASGAGALSLPGGLRLTAGDRGFDLAPGGPAIPPPPPAAEARILNLPGETDWPGGWRIAAELRDRKAGEPIQGRDAWQVSVDADRLKGPLVIRARQAGDRMQPLGMGGRHKSLQDLFVDRQVPRDQREGWPVVTDADRLLWVPGLHLDEWARLGPSTRRILVLRCLAPAGVKR